MTIEGCFSAVEVCFMQINRKLVCSLSSNEPILFWAVDVSCCGFVQCEGQLLHVHIIASTFHSANFSDEVTLWANLLRGETHVIYNCRWSQAALFLAQTGKISRKNLWRWSLQMEWSSRSGSNNYPVYIGGLNVWCKDKEPGATTAPKSHYPPGNHHANH